MRSNARQGGTTIGVCVARVWFGENEQKTLLGKIFIGERGQTGVEQCHDRSPKWNQTSVEILASNPINFDFI
jgi:hypothetical protein